MHIELMKLDQGLHFRVDVGEHIQGDHLRIHHAHPVHRSRADVSVGEGGNEGLVSTGRVAVVAG